MAVSHNKLELIQIAEAVAREKSIEKSIVVAALEDAMARAARSRYGHETNVKAEIDPDTGETRLWRLMEVVEEVESDSAEISLSEARDRNPEAELGDFLSDPLPPVEFGRQAAMSAKQVITQKVRDAERERQYEEYKDRVGEIINGIIKRIEYGHAIIDLGRAEAVLRRDQQLPREPIRQGDRIRAYIGEVRREQRGPQIFLSRTHPQFMAKLFEQEVPEVYDRVIEIKAVARDPGSRAKIGVMSNDSAIDPVGACVGMRGSRVQAVVAELQGEKIDIIQWSEDPATFVVNALAPAEVTKVVLDEETNRIEVVVPDDQLSLAIGRRGQNVRLASQLTGWDIDILTEEDESERRQEEARKRADMFIKALDVDEVIAHLLVAEGFTSIEEVGYVPLAELAEIEGFEEEIAEELRNRARSFLSEEAERLQKRREELKVADDLVEFNGLSLAVVVRLGENDVKNLEDFADLASDELIEYVGDADNMTMDQANDLIMEARRQLGWFDGLEEETEETAEGEEA